MLGLLAREAVVVIGRFFVRRPHGALLMEKWAAKR
jgi:hypothetical protein